MLSQKKKLLHPYPPHPKNIATLPCKMHKFFIFYFFHTYRVHPRYGRVVEASCCDIGWISAEHGDLCSWSVAKKTGSRSPCRRWSLWTFAVTLLAWHSICHTSQPVLFRATNTNPLPAFFRATKVWRNATYLQSNDKVVHCGDIFQVWWARQ